MTVAANTWIRAERRTRRVALFAVAWSIAWLLIALPIVLANGWQTTVWNIFGLVLVFGVPAGGGLWAARRVANAGLWISADRVVVRNPLRTRTLSPKEVDKFSPGVARGVGNGSPCPILRGSAGDAIGVWALGRDGLVWRMTEYLHDMEPLCDDLNELLRSVQPS